MNETATTLSAFDSPKDPCIAGPLGLPSAAWVTSSAVRQLCGNTISARGAYIAFVTHLAGVNADGTGTDLGIGYTWTSNFNGTFGGIAQTASTQPPDPGSGEGGISIVNVNQITNYQYQGIAVSGVNGNSKSTAMLLPGSLVSAKIQFEENDDGKHDRKQPASGKVNGRLLLRNLSAAAISGPLQIVVALLPQGVTLENTSGTFGGDPYITLANGLPLCQAADGETEGDDQSQRCSVGLDLIFEGSRKSVADAVPLVYEGSFN